MINALDKLKSAARRLKSGVRRVQEDLYYVKSGITKAVDRTAHTANKISQIAKKFNRKKDTSSRSASEPPHSNHSIDIKDDTGKADPIYNLSQMGGRIARNLSNPRGQLKVAKSAYKEAKYTLKQKKAELKAMRIDRKLQKAQKTKKQ
jgi:hypothetical protein